MDVVEEHHERTLARERLEQLSHAPEKLFDRERLVGEADRCGHALHDALDALPDERCELLGRYGRRVVVTDPSRLAGGLEQRPEGDALPI